MGALPDDELSFDLMEPRRFRDNYPVKHSSPFSIQLCRRGRNADGALLPVWSKFRRQHTVNWPVNVKESSKNACMVKKGKIGSVYRPVEFAALCVPLMEVNGRCQATAVEPLLAVCLSSQGSDHREQHPKCETNAPNSTIFCRLNVSHGRGLLDAQVGRSSLRSGAG